MAFDELAQRLFGARRAESDAILTDATTGTIHGVALTDSEDGAVTVEITADVTAPEPLEVGGETYFADAGVGVEIPTSESVRAGDEVLVSTYGAGTMRSPVVTAAVGSGDRMAQAVTEAHDLAASVESIAQEAKEVAEATGQNFWSDSDGVHVTEVTQDEWSDSTSPDYHSGANVILNAFGQLFRDGLNNLLAIVTNGIAIYDGNGNEDGNILAKFYTFVLNNHQHARIDFFNGKGFIDYDSNNNELHISARDDSTANVHMNTARINLYQSVDNKISNLEILAGANGAAPPAFIQLDSRNPSGGPFESTIYAYASELLLGYDGDSGSATIPMPQAIAVLSSPVTLFTGTYAQTHSAAVTLSETAANFSRMLIEWETGDGNQGSTMLSNPNGKRFEAVALNCNTGTNPVTYIKWKVFSVNGTTISNYSTDGTNANMQRGEVTLRNNGSVTTTRNEYIGIIRVLGWR